MRNWVAILVAAAPPHRHMATRTKRNLCGCLSRWKVYLVVPSGGGPGFQINRCIQCSATWEFSQ